MEAEKEEAIKRYNNALSFWNIIVTVQVVSVVAFFGYWCFPAITFWFDWFRLVLRNVFFVFLLVNALIGFIYVSFRKTAGQSEPDLYDQYSAAVVRPSPVDYYRVTEVGGHDDKESNGVVMEVVKSKSYRRTRSEKKVRSTVEYRRTKSEKVAGTATWRSEKMDGLSSEEFRLTVETFITQKKKMLLRQNGVVDYCQSDVVWQGLSDDDGTSRGQHRSRSRLVGGSSSTGSGPYLAIAN